MGRSLLVLLCFSALLVIATAFQTQELIESINNHPLRLWKAKKYEQFRNSTLEQFKQQLLQDPKYYKYEQEVISINELKVLQENEKERRMKTNLPSSFDSKVQWADLNCLALNNVLSQGSCGSCWSFSSTEALGSRTCIASKGAVNKIMSAQDLVTCDKFNFGCKGGVPALSYYYMQHTGVVDADCMPYKIGGYQSCPSTCVGSQDSFKSHKHYLKRYKHYSRNVDAIEQEIMTNGPVSADFVVHQDFMSYHSGIYVHTSGKIIGGHVVLLVGWGVSEDGTPYWIVQNSWGSKWALQGYAHFLKGRNECFIERDIYAGEPDLSRL